MAYSAMSRAWLALALPVLSYATYPATYPYENEVMQPPSLPASTPDYTFEAETDPGGYIYQGTLCDMNQHDWSQPFAMTEVCQVAMAHLVYTFKLPPVLPIQTWNCTATGFKFSTDVFYGTVGGLQIDCGDECCSEFLGKPAYTVDPVGFHEKWNKFIQIGMCTEALIESFYCAEIAYDWVCFDRFINASERTHIEACYNVAFQYFLSCPVFKTIGVNEENSAYETDLYLQGLSVEQSFVVYGVHTYADRVCHPYSYYVPTDTSDDDETGSGSAGDESSAMLLSSALLALVGLTTSS